ncbi:uncharacterized protein LOC135843838 isoform X1 [Planococcus citri]|uniref:uncharacterized protein LOC135843838 isoform X1 n=1 Tax=Planococcus citri TaxID=170843 RepID=UPI0031F9438F
MKLVIFLTLLMSTIFVARTASVSSSDEESNTIGGLQNEESNVENKIESSGNEQLFTTSLNAHSEIENTAEFKFTETVSLDDLWSENFETEYISLEIRHAQQQIPRQVLEILRRPSKIAEGIRSESQSASTTDQYEKFRIKVQPSEKITLLDSNDLENSNDTSLQSAASTSNQSPTEFSNDIGQKEGLTEWSIYREYRTTMQPSKHEIHSRKDPYLVAVFDEITQQIDFESNELTDVIENNEFKPQAEIITSPHLHHQSTPLQTIDYTLPSVINKDLIDDLQAPVDQTWKGADYQVRFKRNSPDGDVELWWKKGEDDIYLHAFPNGAIDQNWGFGTVHLGLFRDEDGNLLQVWDFGNTKLEYIKDIKSPPPRRVWEFGNRDEASYWKYRHLIKLWCNANDFFVGEKSCIIY